MTPSKNIFIGLCLLIAISDVILKIMRERFPILTRSIATYTLLGIFLVGACSEANKSSAERKTEPTSDTSAIEPSPTTANLKACIGFDLKLTPNDKNVRNYIIPKADGPPSEFAYEVYNSNPNKIDVFQHDFSLPKSIGDYTGSNGTIPICGGSWQLTRYAKKLFSAGFPPAA